MRYQSFYADCTPLMNEILMELSLCQVVVVQNEDREILEEMQRDVDAKTTFFMDIVSAFVADVHATVTRYHDDIAEFSGAIREASTTELTSSDNRTDLHEFLRQMHSTDVLQMQERNPPNRVMQVLQNSIPHNTFEELLVVLNDFKRDLLTITSASDSTSQHDPHQVSAVNLPWMRHVQEIQLGNWILVRMQWLSSYAMHIQ